MKCFVKLYSKPHSIFLIDAHDHRNFQVILKLLNVNAAACSDPSYKGPSISVLDDPLLKDVKPLMSEDKSLFIKKAMEDFSKFASPNKYLIPNINTLMGFQVEGEAVFDKNDKAIPITGLSVLDETSIRSNSPKPLPVGATRYFC